MPLNVTPTEITKTHQFRLLEREVEATGSKKRLQPPLHNAAVGDSR